MVSFTEHMIPDRDRFSERMRRAEEMLQSTGYKLHQLAAALGYETPFAFSRAFKRYAGISPKQFRKP